MLTILYGSDAKMKLTLILLAVFCISGLNGYVAEKVDIKNREVPPFVKTLNLLHREPPLMPNNSTTVRDSPIMKTIEQYLDHFDDRDTRTWRMRYYVNDNHFEHGGPIFIYLGGEWEITPNMIMWGHLVDMAKEHSACLFYTEHRFYGQSHPTQYLSTDNLQYLDMNQALADVAHFIRTIKQTMPGLENSKVFLSGGSYSATMVVWFERLYPELMDGGWASSAPLLAKLDFKEYKEVVGREFLELGSQACYDRIKNGIADLEAMIDNGQYNEFIEELDLCDNFNATNELDVSMIFSGISNIFAGIAQYQMYDDISGTCDYLMWFEDDITALFNYVEVMVKPYGCMDWTYKSTVDYYIEAEYYYESARPWFHQTCNEFGWYQSTASKNQPYGTKVPASVYTAMCKDIFGERFTEEYIEQQIAETNRYFGGMDVTVENVYMTHGELDPWSPMGHGVEQGATVIPGSSHCSDFGSISSWDSKEMRASKERLAELVRGWMSSDKKSKTANKRKYMRQLLN